MPLVSLTCRSPGRATVALLALLVVAVAWLAAPAQAAPSTSAAIGAAQAGGTPVIKPPVKRPKALTCTVTKRKRSCVARRTTCMTASGTKKCVNGTARCKLAGRIKRCTVINITCTTPKGRRTTCRRTSVKRSATQAFAVRGSQAIPRFLSRSVAGSPPDDAATRLVSSRPGTRAAPPLVPVATSQSPSASGVGAGIGALALASVLMILMLVRRRPRGD
jgi:hypothetical protein